MHDKRIAKERIGNGGWYFIAAFVFLAAGLFALVAAAGGADSSAVAVAGFCLPLAGGLMAIGFALRLTNAIELRLMDIQQQLLPAAAATQIQEGKPGDAAPNYTG